MNLTLDLVPIGRKGEMCDDEAMIIKAADSFLTLPGRNLTCQQGEKNRTNYILNIRLLIDSFQ
jgi:hypothetical protein